MKITIRIDYPIDDAQGIKELVAMRLEDLGLGVRAVSVDAETERQETLWPRKKY